MNEGPWVGDILDQQRGRMSPEEREAFDSALLLGGQLDIQAERIATEAQRLASTGNIKAALQIIRSTAVDYPGCVGWAQYISRSIRNSCDTLPAAAHALLTEIESGRGTWTGFLPCSGKPWFVKETLDAFLAKLDAVIATL